MIVFAENFTSLRSRPSQKGKSPMLTAKVSGSIRLRSAPLRQKYFPRLIRNWDSDENRCSNL
jgi:hypothetical protein